MANSIAKGGASSRLLTPFNFMVLLIDHHPPMAFASHFIDVQLPIDNVTGLAMRCEHASEAQRELGSKERGAEIV